MNPRYRSLDDKMIIGKKSLESTTYDFLIYCIQSANQVTIPSYIKHICSYAFFGSCIENIIIPSEVKTIEKGAFLECQNLQRIEIADDSKLQTIEYEAFNSTKIEYIKIPSNVIKIGENAFANCKQLFKN